MTYETEIKRRWLSGFEPLHMQRDGSAPVLWHRKGELRWVIQAASQRWRELNIISKDAAVLRKAGRDCRPHVIRVLDMQDGCIYEMAWQDFMNLHDTHSSEAAGMQMFVPRPFWTVKEFMAPAPKQTGFDIGPCLPLTGPEVKDDGTI